VILYDKSLKKLSSEATSVSESRLHAIELPWQTRNIPIANLIDAMHNSNPTASLRSEDASDTAFLFHTSGTSTGLPKPISQSHHAAFRVLPSFDGRAHATFSTTPLYHGGIADCLRSWTSNAPIWLFPAAQAPITTKNIQSALLAASKSSFEQYTAKTRYFSSVPYVLEMLAKDSSGLDLLERMDIVGVGGAALGPAIGNYLVGHGVNLVSRFGSAECGFLLSSHREYERDKEWQYLRLPFDNEFLDFEKQTDGSGLYELVVKKGWPHMSKTNRKDGSFATSDLFEPHRSIKGAWRYHSRSGSQITLSTGKKFDPAPIEDLIASTSSLIREAVVFGSNRQSAGVLIFPSKESLKMSKAGLVDEIWKVIREINSKGQDHTRFSEGKIVIKSVDELVLERSSKGTLLRTVAEQRFASDIEELYSSNDDSIGSQIERAVLDSDVESAIWKTIAEACGKDHGLSREDDFYTHGLDSATCIRVRYLLQKVIKPCLLIQKVLMAAESSLLRRTASLECCLRFWKRQGVSEMWGT
jgi:acyl-coenzyme A synthetase/AMP-(fatty) acid ligase